MSVFCPVVLANAALTVVGNGLRLPQLPVRREPDVESSVLRREEGDVVPVRTQPRLRAHRVTEQRGALNQGSFVSRSHKTSFSNGERRQGDEPAESHVPLNTATRTRAPRARPSRLRSPARPGRPEPPPGRPPNAAAGRCHLSHR